MSEIRGIMGDMGIFAKLMTTYRTLKIYKTGPMFPPRMLVGIGLQEDNGVSDTSKALFLKGDDFFSLLIKKDFIGNSELARFFRIQGQPLMLSKDRFP